MSNDLSSIGLESRKVRYDPLRLFFVPPPFVVDIVGGGTGAVDRGLHGVPLVSEHVAMC